MVDSMRFFAICMGVFFALNVFDAVAQNASVLSTQRTKTPESSAASRILLSPPLAYNPCAIEGRFPQDSLSHFDTPMTFPYDFRKVDTHLLLPINTTAAAATVKLDDDRIVAAISDEWIAGDAGKAGHWKRNHGLPTIIYARPEDYDPLTKCYDWKPDDPTNPVRIDPFRRIAPADPFHDFAQRFRHAPSIAVDREFSPNHVFVAFYAKSDATSTNTDLYIARSTDGGLSFPDINGNLLHITDAMLGLTELPDYVNNPDQMVAAIAVDACGDIDIMFYDNRNDTNPNDCEYWVDVYFARISNFDTNPTIQQWRLTPQSFRVDNLPAADSLGDYQNLSVSADGNTIYAAYIARNNADPVNGIRTCYLHRINLNCLGPASDMTGDGRVTDADMIAYMRAYNNQDVNAADVNLDWSVDANDLLLYSEWFANKQ